MRVPMSETAPPRKASAAATPSVDFGYEEVPAPEKARRVRAVFDSVADKYDIMNDLNARWTAARAEVVTQ